MDNEKESGGWSMYKLDDLFDFDGDGELDSVERMEMYQFMDNTANRDRNRFFEDDDEDDDEDDVDLFGEDEVRAEFEDAGLDYDELEYMDPDERREMIEEAGLDPDDYDF